MTQRLLGQLRCESFGALELLGGTFELRRQPPRRAKCLRSAGQMVVQLQQRAGPVDRPQLRLVVGDLSAQHAHAGGKLLPRDGGRIGARR